MIVLCDKHVPKTVFITDEAARNAYVNTPDVEYITVFRAEISLDLGVPVFEIPRTEQDAAVIRHDSMRGFDVVGCDINNDYAIALADLEFALSHLREGLPNGQLKRVRTAMRALMRGAFTMMKFLTQRGVFRE